MERCSRVGDCEGELLVGRSSRSAIGTLVDRESRYLRLVYLHAGHLAEAFHIALLPVLDTLPENLRLTLAWDQGSEMVFYGRISKHFREGIYFAHPARSVLNNPRGGRPVVAIVRDDFGVQGRSDDQRELLDAESVAGHLLKPGSVFGFLAAHRQELFPDEMFADLFPTGRGRPSVPADVMAA